MTKKKSGMTDCWFRPWCVWIKKTTMKTNNTRSNLWFETFLRMTLFISCTLIWAAKALHMNVSRVTLLTNYWGEKIIHQAWTNYIKWQFSAQALFSLLSSASLLVSVNAQVCGFVKWLSVFWVKLVAERLTWLLNGCYLWEGEVDSANIAHSRFASLPLFFPFSLFPPPSRLSWWW